ncbi:hypothetical protein ACFQ1M_17345 [Sungkyunkwania multivorans]|uniref:Uncharacterized protein n=1 Tax=Sungkyunkwania multivorans TaxID=1173618 RepID=A0ABW3D4L5_9FLAO
MMSFLMNNSSIILIMIFTLFLSSSVHGQEKLYKGYDEFAILTLENNMEIHKATIGFNVSINVTEHKLYEVFYTTPEGFETSFSFRLINNGGAQALYEIMEDDAPEKFALAVRDRLKENKGVYFITKDFVDSENKIKIKYIVQGGAPN